MSVQLNNDQDDGKASVIIEKCIIVYWICHICVISINRSCSTSTTLFLFIAFARWQSYTILFHGKISFLLLSSIHQRRWNRRNERRKKYAVKYEFPQLMLRRLLILSKTMLMFDVCAEQKKNYNNNKYKKYISLQPEVRPFIFIFKPKSKILFTV